MSDDDSIWSRVERQFQLVVDRLGKREATAQEASWAQPRAGSSLAHDDSRTTYDPISFQTHSYLTIAQDNLSTIREFLSEVGHIPPVALYSLSRAAIEAAAYGIWILQPGTHAKRVKRSLQLSYDAQRSVVDISSAVGIVHDPTPIYAELEENKRRVKGIPDSADLSKLPTISDILTEVDRDLQIEPATALEAWRICSGMTHANRWVISAVSEVENVNDGLTGQRRIETSVAVLATVLMAAVALRDRLRQRIADAGTTC